MLEMNRYRLNLYELLYQNPLCDYRIKSMDSEKDDINVLFIGNKEYALETYKTMFWASQHPCTRLKMTYMGTTVDANYVKNMLEDKKKFPALEEYIQKGYAGELIYHILDNADTENDSKEISNRIQSLNFDKGLYSYIIVATGDAYADWRYIVSLESICEKNTNRLQKVLVGVYNDGLNEKFANILWENVAKNISIFQFEKSEEYIARSDLRRVAANINLAYSVKYDERLNVVANLKEFDRLCQEEFNDRNPVKYNADSSYASAVHISSKLTYCLENERLTKSELDNWQDIAMQILASAVECENELYKKLYYWEHKRWNAYTVMRGYRHPQKGEWGFVYSDGRKNVDPDAKLHVCLCESGEELNVDMNKPAFWKSIKKELNPLDYASYYCNSIAKSKAKAVEKNVYVKYDFLNGIMFRELREAVEDLFAGVGNANDNYKKVMKKTLKRVDIAADELLMKELADLDNELGIVVIRNQHINFFEYDAQLVRLIPFSLWYGEKYKEVFVFSKGVAAKDVTIPTLLYAKKAYFVSDDGYSEKYQKIIQRYFDERGSNTATEFINYSDVIKLTKDKDIDEFVISGEGDLKEDFLTKRNNVINVRYDAKKNKINNGNYFCGLNTQSFSVKEFIQLQGGDIKDEFRDTFSKQTYIDMEKIFWDFSGKKQVGQYMYIPWNKGAKLLTKKSRVDNILQARKEAVHFTKTEHKCIFIYDASISQEKYLENNVDSFLLELYDFRLIGKYETVLDSEYIKVRFITYHKELCELIDCCLDDGKVAKIQIEKDSITPDEMIGVSSKEFAVNIENDKDKNKEQKYLAYQYEDLYNGLIKAGVLEGFNVKGKLLDSIRIKDMRAFDLFDKEGDVFEKITFHRFQNSNMFNDVKNGVHFYWNREAGNKDLLKKMLKEGIEKAASEDIVDLIDAETFCKIYNEISRKYKKETDYEKNQVSNEIDVIAIRGMQAYFISCKATYEIKKEYLDEISNHAKNAGAVPILAMGNPTEESGDAILSRATELNHILMLGREELIEQSKFNEAIGSIL